MITNAFRDAMRTALERQIAPYTLQEACPALAEGLPFAVREGASIDALLPVCWMIEYNEHTPRQEKTPEAAVKLLRVKKYEELAEDFPVLYQALKPEEGAKAGKSKKEEAGDAKKGFENVAYQVFIKYFKDTEFDGRSIARIGLGLGMTVDEINRVLLSYGKQTITWHRVDDLLFRYAAEKGWTFAHFQRAYEQYLIYRADMEKKQTAGADTLAAGSTPILPDAGKRRDSAYMTRFNRRRLEDLLHASAEAEDDAQVYQKLHAYFIDTERTASGAPRRALAKICRWAHGDFSLQYVSELLEQEDGGRVVFGECPDTKAMTAYQMMMEAAGETPAVIQYASPEAACATVNRVIRALNDLCGGVKTPSHPPFPQGIQYLGGRAYFSALAKWPMDALLLPETIQDREALSLIAECLYRDLPQEYQAYGEISAMDGDARHADVDMVIKAAGIALSRGTAWEDSRYFESALRRGVFHLLLCCNSSKARRILNKTVQEALCRLGWSNWDGLLSANVAQALVRKLRTLPTENGEDDAGKSGSPVCSGIIQKEVKSLFAQVEEERGERERLYARFEALRPQDRDAWITAYLNQKFKKAMAVLDYTPVQAMAFQTQWQQLGTVEKEYCLVNLLRRQYITERDINEPISFALNITRGWKAVPAGQKKHQKTRESGLYIELGKRNSEPGRSLILLMALAHFGYVAESDPRSFTPQSCEKYISDCVKGAWGTSWLLSQTDGGLDAAVENLIRTAMEAFSGLKKRNGGERLSVLWQEALGTACRDYRSICREREVRAVTRFNSVGKGNTALLENQNELFNSSLMAGQWKYDREKKKAT